MNSLQTDSYLANQSNFLNKEFIQNFVVNNSVKVFTIFWSKEENYLIKRLKLAYEQNAEIILTDFFPDELPNLTTNEEYKFFREKFLFCPPFYSLNIKNKNSDPSDNIIYLHDNSTNISDPFYEILSTLSNVQDFEYNIISIDTESENIKELIDKSLHNSKKIILNTDNPNIIHYVSIVAIDLSICVKKVSGKSVFTSRNSILGYYSPKELSSTEVSIRNLFQDFIINEENDLELFDVNKDLRFISDADTYESSLEKIYGIKFLYENIFSECNKTIYHLNPSILDNFYRNRSSLLLNRFQMSFIFHNLKHLKARGFNSDFDKISFYVSLDKILLSWIHSEFTELECVRIIRVLEDFQESNKRVIDLAKSLNLPPSKKNLFGILSECFMIASFSDYIDDKRKEDLQSFSHLCIDLDKQKGSNNHYEICHEIFTESVTNSNRFNNFDFSTLVKSKGSLVSSIKAMKFIALHASSECLLTLPFESMSKDHAYNLLEGILFRHGKTFFETFWQNPLATILITEDFFLVIREMELRVKETPWQLIYISKMITKSQFLPANALKLPVYDKLLLAYGLKKIDLSKQSRELTKSIDHDQLSNQKEALLLLTISDNDKSLNVKNISDKFRLSNLNIENLKDFHENFYPLLYKYSSVTNSDHKEMFRRMSDGFSPFFNIF